MIDSPIISVYSEREARTATDSIAKSMRHSFTGHDVRLESTELFMRRLRENSADICILPAIFGEQSMYHEFLGQRGMGDMRDYVERGGVLVTICAGSYYICANTRYTPEWGHPKGRTNPTPLFNALAHGPIASEAKKPGDPSEAPYEDIVLTPLTYRTADGEWLTANIAYGNGPALFPHENIPGLTVLARYAKERDFPAAVAWQERGAGAILWLGALPYLGATPLQAMPGSPQADLLEQLAQNEPGRRDFWNSLTNRIKTHLNLKHNLG